jgi:hypothetical protein
VPDDDLLEPDVAPADKDGADTLERDEPDEGLTPEEHLGLTPPD